MKCARLIPYRLLFTLAFLLPSLANGGESNFMTPADLERSINDPRVQHRHYAFEETGEHIPYALFVPDNYKADKTAPLIISLHGLGRTYDWLMGYAGFLDYANTEGYIVVTPLGYTRRGWYGAWPQDTDGRDLSLIGPRSEQDVMNVLALVKNEFSIDENRTYLWGHSMGGAGTWHLAVKYPDLWAAIGVVAPAPHRDTSPDVLEAIRHIPVIAIHGTEDDAVPVDTTRTWVNKMKSLGMQHVYIEIEGADHTDLILKDRENNQKIIEFFNITRKVY